MCFVLYCVETVAYSTPYCQALFHLNLFTYHLSFLLSTPSLTNKPCYAGESLALIRILMCSAICLFTYRPINKN